MYILKDKYTWLVLGILTVLSLVLGLSQTVPLYIIGAGFLMAALAVLAYATLLKSHLDKLLLRSDNEDNVHNLRQSKAHWLFKPLLEALHSSAIYQAEKNCYVATLNAVPDVIIKTDAFGEIIDINNAGELFLSKARAVVEGMRYAQLCKDLGSEDAATNYNDLIASYKKQPVAGKQVKSNLQLSIGNRQLSIEQRTSIIIDDKGHFTGTVVLLRDVTKEAKLRDRLRFQANHDSVTKLFNRFKFEQRLVDAWHNAQEHGLTHALLQIDMDRFKLVNDNAGHGAGDQLLRDVGLLLQRVVRQSDVCARIGGDEFAILIYNVSPDITVNVMSKLNKAFEQLNFSYSGHVFDVGASIGATLIDKNSPPVVEIKRQADAACYLAKNKGINHHQLFSLHDADSTSLQQEPRWAARINQALELDQFELYYQPIRALDAITQNKFHIEILLRLKSDGELLSPSLFLPAVERFRLSNKVDFWVVSKTFEWFEHKPELWDQQVIAINLSGDSIINEEFIDQVLSCYQHYQFPAHSICFEITETAAIANMTKAVAMVEKLRTVGFSIALDDFGKGFSTFSYLKSLPAQYIKIDGSYVKDIVNNTSDYSIVSAITTMAKTMDMKTIAEFVQCEDTVSMLKVIGVDFVQGYGVAIPRSLSDYSQACFESEIIINSSESENTHYDSNDEQPIRA